MGQDASAVGDLRPAIENGCPGPIRIAALRGAILARKANGVAVAAAAYQGSDQTLFVAAVRTAQEMTVAGTTQALTDALAKNGRWTANKILIIATLGSRGCCRGARSVASAQAGRQSVRLAALQALPQLPQAASVPVLVPLMNNADAEIAAAAKGVLRYHARQRRGCRRGGYAEEQPGRDRIAGMEMAAPAASGQPSRPAENRLAAMLIRKSVRRP